MGRYDPNWIIILFFIYLTTFWVEKLEELACKAILVVVPNLEIWVQKTIKNILESFLGIKLSFFSKPYYGGMF